MEEELRALLLADSGVTALASDRVNFGAHPQGEPLPAVVLNTISGAEGYTLSGPDGLLQARVQVDVYALTYGDAKRLARAVIAVLSGYSGGSFQGVFHESSRDSREDGEARRPFRVSMDFTVVHNG
ncbi:DUF3168 domain-containing protein [Pseudooceanicola sp.]|uniref:DUF3168 domain-containing protein n=1 Tax=Pseudooceanicola sp. TaxID=1914328 RepID=UPI0040588AF4